CPSDVRGAFRYYMAAGIHTIPLPARSKRPALNGWPELRLDEADLDTHLPEGQEHSIGALLGEPSGGLVDVDLDTAEAITAAPFLLPPTGRISGRQSKPRSHWWYFAVTSPAKASEEYKDLDGEILVELRSTGGQTVLPPSLHPDSGERTVWHTEDRAAHVAAG